MSDIDFEELDKAVNSLMNQQVGTPDMVTSPTPVESSDTNTAPLAPTVSPRPVAPVDTTPVPERPAPDMSARFAAPTVTASTPPPTPLSTTEHSPASAPAPIAPVPAVAPAIRRSTGKFMDVVVPPVKTRSAPTKAAPEKPVARDTGVIAPMTEVSTQPIDAVAPVVSVDDTAPNVSSSEPMQSPFLTGVTVDKRPLGDLNDSPDFSYSPDAPVADPWVTETEEGAPSADVIPPELSADVVALESEASIMGMTNTDEPAAVELSEPQPDVSVPSPQPEPLAEEPAVESAPQLSGPGDIVPQYAPETAASPEPSAIFDAASEEVPQQLSHPEHKKSGWMVFVWILLLIVVGVGGGIAAWYFLAQS